MKPAVIAGTTNRKMKFKNRYNDSFCLSVMRDYTPDSGSGCTEALSFANLSFFAFVSV
jgi:hypothetical protein